MPASVEGAVPLPVSNRVLRPAVAKLCGCAVVTAFSRVGRHAENRCFALLTLPIDGCRRKNSTQTVCNVVLCPAIGHCEVFLPMSDPDKVVSHILGHQEKQNNQMHHSVTFVFFSVVQTVCHAAEKGRNSNLKNHPAAHRMICVSSIAAIIIAVVSQRIVCVSFERALELWQFESFLQFQQKISTF